MDATGVVGRRSSWLGLQPGCWWAPCCSRFRATIPRAPLPASGRSATLVTTPIPRRWTPRGRPATRPAPIATTRTSSVERSGFRLVAGRPLDGTERIGEALSGAAGPERPWLAPVGRPSGHGHDLEAGGDASVRHARDAAIEVGGPEERAAAHEAPPALAERIGLAHGPELRHEGERTFVGHGDAVAIDHREREAGALKQPREVAAVGHRRDARTGTPFLGEFRLQEGPAKAVEGVATEH